jgi:hypothetical protein
MSCECKEDGNCNVKFNLDVGECNIVLYVSEEITGTDIQGGVITSYGTSQYKLCLANNSVSLSNIPPGTTQIMLGIPLVIVENENNIYRLKNLPNRDDIHNNVSISDMGGACFSLDVQSSNGYYYIIINIPEEYTENKINLCFDTFWFYLDYKKINSKCPLRCKNIVWKFICESVPGTTCPPSTMG